ncbi:MAG: hypothetical protein IPL99_22005 [Candidatus Competibacteraceae bacterium]|nr:hypothetical protein [Candidatus Competibacteraceae bacterium]
MKGLVLSTLETRMAAVYAAREGPPAVDLPTQHAPALAGYAPPARTLKAAITAKPTPWRWVAQRLGCHLPRC